MASVPKVFIKIDSSAEQQETLNKSRKTLKVLQKTAVDKENLAGRPLHGKGFTKAKSDDFSVCELTKRKKIENKTTQTEAHEVSRSAVAVTEKDLTTEESPSEHYWEILAEKRRQALDETLGENKRLHERIEGLEDELNTSRQMLEEAKHLVEVLTEMLNENETDAAGEKGLLAEDVPLNETIPELPEETDEEDE